MTDTPRDELIAKNLPWIAAVVVALGATVVRIRFGWPAVILWLAFCALSGSILLFWESLRSALDPEAAGDDNDLDHRALAQSELEERKRAALRALRDVKQEHSIGKLSDDDAKDLENRYRTELRAVMQELDDLLGDHLGRAESEFDRIAAETAGTAATPVEDKPAAADSARAEPSKSEPSKSESSAEDRAECPSCKTINDRDARFCKSCGTRFESNAS